MTPLILRWSADGAEAVSPVTWAGWRTSSDDIVPYAEHDQRSQPDAGSFSGAAKQLRLGQSAVSKTIAQLEDRVGVRLLLRSTHGFTATEAGRNFHERAKRTNEEAEQAEAAARGDATTLQGRLRVSAPVTFTRLHIIPQSLSIPDGASRARRRDHSR
jgi:regulatory helix-turn-helix LysR family protein